MKRTLGLLWKKRGIRWFISGCLMFFFLMLVLNVLFPLRVNIHYSQVITAADGTVMHAFLSDDDKWRMKTELNEITPLLRKTIIEKEDRYFYYHPGINPVAIVRALINNLVEGKKTSGASTITMQVVRMLQPKPRTYGNKLIEVFRALQLELHFSKDEILQLYLTLVPYGGNIEGVKAASLIYFGQLPNYLSLAQVVTLSIIPNRPSSLVIGRDNEQIRAARNQWLKRFEKDHLFPEQEIRDALAEPLNAKRKSLPQLAPHLSVRLASAFPSMPVIHSTIKLKEQQRTENLAYNYIKRIHHTGISNCAVLVLNNLSGEVEAYVGSADFNNADDGGQVDGVYAIRSPGSTLKPFLYGIAFDQGLVTPKSVLTDVPANFSGYAPENFDRKFHGTVTVENALANSLNVPAVKMLDAVGVARFVSMMKVAGFRNVAQNENQLGLSVILGGCGVSLEELVRLYSAFGHGGTETPMQFTRSAGAATTGSARMQGPRLLSPASAFMITNILTQHTRPDLPVNYESSMHLPMIAWKTGTSYGRRDAWSIGYNRHYTIGVWVGNFDGTGVPQLTGAEVATPLLFDVFNSIDYNSSYDWVKAPKDVDFRLVCSVTGKVPSDFCTSQVMDYYIPGISSTAKCEHEKDVFVSADESISYCRNCLPQSGFKKKYYPNLSPELISFYESGNIPYQKIPPHNPGCTRVYADHAPGITSPTNGLEYIFEKDGGNQLMLTCTAGNEVKKVFWYVNDRFYCTAGVHDKIFFTPQAGEQKISCADDKGRNSDIHVKVTYLQ